MPGATLVTRLKVYDTLGPDGQRGGTPHVHLLCTEMYFVTAGSGAVDIIDSSGFKRVALTPQAALIFSPGTVHRLINPNGDLELFIVMQNSGLPERGDNIVSFSDDVLSSAARYREAMRVKTFEDAYRRRDAGVEGFLALKKAFGTGLEPGRHALERFYRRAAERTETLRKAWQSVVERGPLREAQTSVQHIGALEHNNLAYLKNADHHLIEPGDFKTPGFCGALNRYFDPATLELEGVSIEKRGS